MQPIYHLLAQRRLAVLICAAALLLKLIVPAGYMIDSTHGRLTITLCASAAPARMVVDMPSMRDKMPDHGKPKQQSKAEMPCAFSGFSAAALAAADPIQLAALLTFILAIGVASTSLPSPYAQPHLRPPLRGPPHYL